MGDLVRKQKRDGSGPAENESHVLFEVVSLANSELVQRDDGTSVYRQAATLEVKE
jgi:hypothetical protein